MNVALRFIETLGDAVASALTRTPMHAVMATPRFASSRSVVFLLGPADTTKPTLVAKVARLGGRDEGLTREATNLLALHRSWPETESVPHLVAHGVFLGHQILLETAVAGRAMTPELVRRRPASCIDAVIDWLIEHHEKLTMDAEVCGSFSALVEDPLERLEVLLKELPECGALVERVRQQAEHLRMAGIPTVFEHGDLSAPNLLMQPNRRAGILDWELATPHGLPAVDVFFFLAFVAASLGKARAPLACVEAFDRAFFGPEAWARPYVLRYSNAIGLPTEALPALFLLCWSRYLATVPVRQAWAIGGHVDHVNAGDLNTDKYWHWWKHAVEHIDDFGCAA